MINFNSLKCVVNNKYSFVGIEKRQGILYFYLPKGFTNEINRNDKFNNNRKLFFLFHKIYNTFKEICANKGYLDLYNSIKKQGRDGLISSVKGAKINDDGNELENIFYSKLDAIDNLINIYDKPRILSLAYRLGNSDKVDISHIHKYLHKAMYLSNHTAYVDQMFLQKRSMQYQPTDIVTMYCYLLCEVKHQLNEKVNSEIESLADQFQYQYLGCDGSLFNEQSYSQVLDLLKDTLEQINCNTPIKDTDYWQYYDSINSFLYGDLEQIEDGKIWGVSNFYNVWESMCLTYLTQYTDPSYLLRLDTQYVSSKILEKLESVSKIIDLSNSLTTTDRVPLIPDAVVLSLITSEDKFVNGYKIQADRHWNDNLYQTIFKDIDEMHDIKIGYICQKQISHTTEKLDRLYKKDKDENLIIDTLLPKKFYSFWNIPESIDFKYIHKMCYFNHLFYIALEREIITWESFIKKILKPLGVTFGLELSYDDPYSNVFTHSLLRDRYTINNERVGTRLMYSSEYIEREFTRFIKLVSELSNWYKNLFEIEIIDIKYLTSDYLHDVSEIENIKTRSIRKQFVYEYLVQRGLKKQRKKFKDLSVRSSFWLPSYRPDDPNLIEEGETFMDGYIQLKNINFAVLAENYIT